MLDEVETLQRVRSDARAKALNALRQLIDEVHDGHFPGLYLLITGTPAFFEGRQGIPLLPPLADRLHTEFAKDPRFDNPRAPQLRLTGFDQARLVELGAPGARPVLSRHPRSRAASARVADDAFLERFAAAVAGELGGKVGIAPRLFLRKLVDVLDKIEQFPDFDPYTDYEVTDRRRRAVRRRTRRADRRRRPARSVMDAFDLLHPGVQYHLANTLRWNGLRPTQADAVEPILAGDDALVLAPTAGGKTEAAMFPLLSRMAAEDWQGVSVLYVCPLRALLNNLQPRIDGYCQLARAVGGGLARRRRAGRSGSGSCVDRARHPADHTRVAGIDAGVHQGRSAGAVLGTAGRGGRRDPRVRRRRPRLAPAGGAGAAVAGCRPRSAADRAVGDRRQPDELLSWLQGSFHGRDADGRRARRCPPRPPRPRSPSTSSAQSPTPPRSLRSLHRGEKRLVFVDSRRQAEELGAALRDHGIETYISHSSLSAAERRRSEAAFAEARDTVIVATSTLELGIDVGDLDRVIQIGSTRTVASFLQRLGRTGRRAGTTRNCLFLCVDDESRSARRGHAASGGRTAGSSRSNRRRIRGTSPPSS